MILKIACKKGTKDSKLHYTLQKITCIIQTAEVCKRKNHMMILKAIKKLLPISTLGNLNLIKISRKCNNH